MGIMRGCLKDLPSGSSTVGVDDLSQQRRGRADCQVYHLGGCQGISPASLVDNGGSSPICRPTERSGGRRNHADCIQREGQTRLRPVCQFDRPDDKTLLHPGYRLSPKFECVYQRVRFLEENHAIASYHANTTGSYSQLTGGRHQ